MHTKDLAHAGETSVRVNLVAAWRESTVFTDAGHAALVSLIVLINATNRLAVITRQPGGNHQPGQFG
jgi:alkylhydroperoxidase family enzyme